MASAAIQNTAYVTPLQAEEMGNSTRFSPSSYIEKAPNLYCAIVSYLKNNHGEWAVHLLDNVIRDRYNNKLTEQNITQVAEKMGERSVLIEENTVKTWKTHFTQIKNAWKGEGNSVQGFLESLT